LSLKINTPQVESVEQRRLRVSCGHVNVSSLIYKIGYPLSILQESYFHYINTNIVYRLLWKFYFTKTHCVSTI